MKALSKTKKKKKKQTGINNFHLNYSYKKFYFLNDYMNENISLMVFHTAFILVTFSFKGLPIQTLKPLKRVLSKQSSSFIAFRILNTIQI